jgi:hypothetical protein
VGVLSTGIHLEAFEHVAAHAVVRKHAPHCRADDAVGVLVKLVAQRNGLEAAGIARVFVVDLLGQLAASSVMLPALMTITWSPIGTRSKGRLVFAEQRAAMVYTRPVSARLHPPRSV